MNSKTTIDTYLPNNQPGWGLSFKDDFLNEL